MTTAIWWIRRDLRLGDNPALSAALQAASHVLPLFILDDALLRSSRLGENRLRFLLEGLRQLDTDLRQRGSRLVVRSGDPHAVLSELISSEAAGAIYAEEDVPKDQQHMTKLNADLAKLPTWKSITKRKAPLPEAEEWKDKTGKLSQLLR